MISHDIKSVTEFNVGKLCVGEKDPKQFNLRIDRLIRIVGGVLIECHSGDGYRRLLTDVFIEEFDE